MRITALLPLHSRGFWTGFLTVSLLATIAAFKLMFLVEPGLNVDISFSRQQALAAAADFHQQQFPQLQTERTAAAFISDRDFQNYVELEAGGLDVYQSLVPDPDVSTHFWRVRTFTPGQKQELITAFSPQGTPIAFSYLIPDDEPGPALDENAARVLAEAGMRNLLGERFASYAPLQEQEVRQSSGRMDYTFTYQHKNILPADARLRLNVRVAGDQVVAIDNTKFIPEAFNQRFGELRALNTQISQIANGLMGALLGLVGLCGGGIWLYRRNQLQWRRALLPAAVVATGMAAAELANISINWLGYNTSTSEQSFIVQQVAQAGLVVVIVSLAFATIYAVAEGLTRHAFPEHPRLWDSFKPGAAASPEIVGRVLGAYAWTGLFLFYAVIFLLFSSKVLGWWQPSSLNVDPNILASARPALAPIFNALQAGTWEECFFRAIPLAFAALLDRHFGSGKKILVVMLFVQALIFAAAHANYPQLPGYSRLVELFIPAMVFGLVYLRFGLLVGILTHFTYDLSLMSLPIFLADDASLWLDRILVLLAGAAPLLTVLWAWKKQGKLLPLPEAFRNGIQPVPQVQEESPATEPEQIDAPVGAFQFNAKALVAVALVSIVLIVVVASKTQTLIWPVFSIDRAAAVTMGEQVLQENGITLSGEWHRTTTIQSGRSTAFDFVWRESDAAQVQSLLGTYLSTPYWISSWRRFDGPVENRSEVWQVLISPEGKLLQLNHQLPEAATGATLDKDRAEAVARNWITELGWSPSAPLELKSVMESTRPARSDWMVTFLDKNTYAHNDANAAIIVRIAGDEVAGYARIIDLPETWLRAENETNSGLQVYQVINSIFMLAIFGCAAATFFRKHSGRKFSFNLALPWLLVAVLPYLLLTWLRIDGRLDVLQTTMDWTTQLSMLLGGLLLGAAAMGVLIFLAAQAIHAQRPRKDTSVKQDFILGSMLAIGLLGYQSLLALLFPSTEANYAVWADYSTSLPGLAVMLNGLQGITSSMVMLLLGLGLSRFTTHTWRFVLISALAIGWWLTGAFGSRELLLGLSRPTSAMLTVALVYMLIRRQQMGLAIVMLGMLVALRQANLLAASYPWAAAHALISVVCCAGVVFILLKHWHQHVARGSATQ